MCICRHQYVCNTPYASLGILFKTAYGQWQLLEHSDGETNWILKFIDWVLVNLISENENK